MTQVSIRVKGKTSLLSRFSRRVAEQERSLLMESARLVFIASQQNVRVDTEHLKMTGRIDDGGRNIISVSYDTRRPTGTVDRWGRDKSTQDYAGIEEFRTRFLSRAQDVTRPARGNLIKTFIRRLFRSLR